MASAETARLVASLELQDNFSKGIRSAGQSVSNLTKNMARSRAVAVGLGVGLERIAEKGISALGGAIENGIASAQELEKAQAQTAAVIQSTGGKAGVTAAQVRSLAEAQESVTTADDRSIQSGENLLLTFTNIGSSVFPQATKSMVDMAIALNNGDAATADFHSAAIQLGKALNDPIKGVGALQKVGVSLTAAQKTQIVNLLKLTKDEQKHYLALRKTNKAAAERYKTTQIASRQDDAQRIILKELETEFGKAGEAAGKGFTGDVNRARDAIEDAEVAIAQGLMPAVGEVAQELTKTLGDPQVQSGLKELGKGIGEAIKGIVSFAKTIPWDQVGQGLTIAAEGAKAIASAFLSLPPWVQAAVISGWGLNKLTGGALGGALGGIFGDLGKGLLQKLGLMRITAGVVQVSGPIAGGGAGIPTAGAAGTAGKGLSTLAKVSLIGEAIGLVAAVNEVRDGISAASSAQAAEVHTQTQQFIASQPSQTALLNALGGVDQGIKSIRSNPLNVLVQGSALDELSGMRKDLLVALGTTTPGKLADDLAPIAQTSDIKALGGKFTDDISGTTAAAAKAGQDVTSQTRQSGIGVANATYAAARGIQTAIANNRPITNVDVRVSATTIQQTVDVNTRYGPTGSDRTNGDHFGSGLLG